jgi:hypothetical protein
MTAVVQFSQTGRLVFDSSRQISTDAGLAQLEESGAYCETDAKTQEKRRRAQRYPCFDSVRLSWKKRVSRPGFVRCLLRGRTKR